MVNVENCQFLKRNCNFLLVLWVKWKQTVYFITVLYFTAFYSFFLPFFCPLNSSMTSFLSEILLPFSILNDLKSRAWCAINCTNQIWRFGQPNSSHIYLVVQIACTCLFIWLRDCLQITFVTLNGLCPLSKNPPPPLNLTDNIKMDVVYQTKSNEKCMPFLHYISSFEGTTFKIL